TNYMLTAMSETGADYAAVLAEAQTLGYAEADPTADVSGMDSASKAVILAGLAFGVWVSPSEVHREGIDGLEPADFAAAARLGHTIKLLAVAEATSGGVVVRVHPTLIPLTHPLAGVRGATNAVYIEGDSVGQLLFAGPGAGGMPTATSVLGDVISAARGIVAPSVVVPPVRVEVGEHGDFGALETQWCLRIEVEDAPGVLARIAGVFGSLGGSNKPIRQDGRGDGATLLIVTHAAPEAAQRKSPEGLVVLAPVREVTSALRLEGGVDRPGPSQSGLRPPRSGPRPPGRALRDARVAPAMPCRRPAPGGRRASSRSLTGDGPGCPPPDRSRTCS